MQSFFFHFSEMKNVSFLLQSINNHYISGNADYLRFHSPTAFVYNYRYRTEQNPRILNQYCLKIEYK